MTGAMWRPLDRALDEAGGEGRRIAMWWRDDDAVAHTPALDRLLALAGRSGWPLALAAIPGRLEPSLAPRLSGESGTHVLVHGLGHRDHAPAGAKRAEFGEGRSPDDLAHDLAEALRLAAAAGLPRALPVLVPPWNRMAPALVPRLPELGFLGLSAFRDALPGAARLARVDTHLDPVDWRSPRRGLVSPDGLVADLAARIARGPAGPLGLLTHHLVQGEDVWRFCEGLLERLSRHPAIVPTGAAALFGGGGIAPAVER